MPVSLPLLDQLKLAGLPGPVPEYRFHKKRKWRFDLCWPEWLLAVEYEGGVWSVPQGGRHQRAAGYSRDLEKYNAAVLLGWRVLRFDSRMVRDGQALRMIEQALGINSGTQE